MNCAKVSNNKIFRNKDKLRIQDQTWINHECMKMSQTVCRIIQLYKNLHDTSYITHLEMLMSHIGSGAGT